MRGILVAVLVALCPLPGSAADRVRPPAATADAPLYFGPVSPLQNRQAQRVATSRECWRGCQRQCAAEFLACGYQLSGAECLSATDACDRACQRRCRSTGNPLLDFLD